MSKSTENMKEVSEDISDDETEKHTDPLLIIKKDNTILGIVALWSVCLLFRIFLLSFLQIIVITGGKNAEDHQNIENSELQEDTADQDKFVRIAVQKKGKKKIKCRVRNYWQISFHKICQKIL